MESSPTTSHDGLIARLVSLGRPFWMLCTMEMWERLAYYGLRVVVGVYIAQADVVGGLHWTQADRAQIFFWWAIFQSVLPTFTGGLADRYGYKNTIFVSITLKVLGYLLMGTQTSYWGFFLGAMTLATGTALFKPGIQGSLAHNIKKEDSSLGWGIFYWLVNVGAMIGPGFAAFLRGEDAWPRVFYGCAAVVSLNYAMLFTYSEPDSGYDKSKGLGVVMAETFKNLFEARLLTLLGILTGFWLMMYQLWDLHPFFISDWVDSSSLASIVPETWIDPNATRGQQVGQEHLLNLNSLIIVLFVVPVSWAVQKMKALRAMLIGTIIAIFGILVAGTTTNAYFLLFGIFLFSAGEMLTGPKKSEYLGKIAPAGKKGLYLGYVNIPVGIGQAVGAQLSAYFYARWGEKAVLAQRYLAEHGNGFNGDFATLDQASGTTRETAFQQLMTVTNLDAQAATNMLWDTYNPWMVWIPFALIGVMSGIGLLLFNRAASRWTDMNE